MNQTDSECEREDESERRGQLKRQTTKHSHWQPGGDRFDRINALDPSSIHANVRKCLGKPGRLYQSTSQTFLVMISANKSFLKK